MNPESSELTMRDAIKSLHESADAGSAEAIRLVERFRQAAHKFGIVDTVTTDNSPFDDFVTNHFAHGLHQEELGLPA